VQVGSSVQSSESASPPQDESYQQYSKQTGNKHSQASTTPKPWSQRVEKELITQL